LTVVDGIPIAAERTRPFYLRFLKGYLRVIEAGKPPTCVNIAHELGISKQAVSSMFLRHPELRAWIDRHVEALARQLTGTILYRTGMLGSQGSHQHAELFFKFTTGGFERKGGAFGDEEAPASVSVANYTLNLLVPRPDMTAIAKPALPAMPAKAVEVR